MGPTGYLIGPKQIPNGPQTVPHWAPSKVQLPAYTQVQLPAYTQVKLPLDLFGRGCIGAQVTFASNWFPPSWLASTKIENNMQTLAEVTTLSGEQVYRFVPEQKNLTVGEIQALIPRTASKRGEQRGSRIVAIWL